MPTRKRGREEEEEPEEAKGAECGNGHPMVMVPREVTLVSGIQPVE